MQKKQVLQDQGYVEGVESAWCMLHTMLQGCMKYPMLLMSKGSKVHLIYNVDSNMKSSNYIKIWFKALIYFELEQTSN